MSGLARSRSVGDDVGTASMWISIYRDVRCDVFYLFCSVVGFVILEFGLIISVKTVMYIIHLFLIVYVHHAQLFYDYWVMKLVFRHRWRILSGLMLLCSKLKDSSGNFGDTTKDIAVDTCVT